MKILVVAAADATNLSIANIIKEFVKRGHIIDVYAVFTDYKSIRMFKGVVNSIRDIKELTEKNISDYDIAFCGTDEARRLRWFNIYVFSYNFIMNEWPTEGSDFMFTAIKNRIVRYKEDCASMPVGVAKNDTPIENCTNKKQILYIDAGHIPFGHHGKEQVAQMLLDICNAYPDYKLVIKPRWLLSDTKFQTHRNTEHIYIVLKEKTEGKLPENMVLLDEYLDLQKLIDESNCVVTTSISCYMDVALRGKGLIVVGGLDCEDQYQLRRNVVLKQDYDNAIDAGCVVDYREVISYLPHGIKVSENHLNKMLPCKSGTSKQVADIVEFVFDEYVSKGVYPKIKEYSFDSSKSEFEVDMALNMKELKYKRMKNGVIGNARMFSYVDAPIDDGEWYRELDHIYKKYTLDETGFQTLHTDMQKKWYKILVKNKKLLMNDSINQSYILMAMYELGLYENIYEILPENILCTGPYHYYMGKLHQKNREVKEAMMHYISYINDVVCRTYSKYVQDSGSSIREAYSYVLQNYNGHNIAPKDFAELYLNLYRNAYQGLIRKDILIRTHSFILAIAEQLEGVEPLIAKECLVIYAKNTRTFIVDLYRQKLQDIEREKSRIRLSISCRVGFGITWLPRKTRKIVKDIKHKGIKVIWKDNVNKWQENIKKQHVYQIAITFFHKVLRGYDIYEKVMREYGDKAEIILSGPATGDAYLYGMMFQAYTNENYPDKENIFVVYKDFSIKAAKLFSIKNVMQCDMDQFRQLYNLSMFLTKTNIDSMHYHIFYRQIAILAYLEGLHNYNFFSESMDCLGISSRTLLTKPSFNYNGDYLNILDENNLKLKKTVLLAPYAKSVKAIPMFFWVQLAQRLKGEGFCVCTNSVGDAEPPVGDTPAVFVPYDQSVPFVESAGAVIGIRSGFLDVISSAKCLKISLFNENNYKRGICHIRESFSLSAMYEDPKQYDLLYSAETAMELIDQLVNMVSIDLKSEEHDGRKERYGY